jgi:hypothetical protein
MKPTVVAYLFDASGDIVTVVLRSRLMEWTMPMAEWCRYWRGSP